MDINVNRALNLLKSGKQLLQMLRFGTNRFPLADADLVGYQAEEMDYLQKRNGRGAVDSSSVEGRMEYIRAIMDLQKFTVSRFLSSGTLYVPRQ